VISDLFDRLVLACRDNPDSVVPTKGALADAQRDLHLDNKEELISLIACDGLTHAQLINVRSYENMQKINNGAIAYAYRCMMGNYVVYLSVSFLSKTSKFCIKSLKWHDDETNKYLKWLKQSLPGEKYRGII
jgi:hypothetical protein